MGLVIDAAETVTVVKTVVFATQNATSVAKWAIWPRYVGADAVVVRHIEIHREVQGAPGGACTGWYRTIR